MTVANLSALRLFLVMLVLVGIGGDEGCWADDSWVLRRVTQSQKGIYNAAVFRHEVDRWDIGVAVLIGQASSCE